MRSATLLVATLAAATWGVSAQQTDEDANWPQFRGIRAGGIAEGAETPVHWNGETGENLLWKTAIPGLGHSSPIVWGDHVCLTTAVSGTDDEDVLKVGLYGDIAPVVDDRPWQWEVRCLDKTTGAERWTAVAHRGVPAIPRHPKATHANSTLATDGTYLVAMFGSEGLYGYELETGREVWSVELGLLESGYYIPPTAMWGFATSPVIHDGLVVIQADVINGSFLAVFDVTTGSEVWRAERDEGADVEHTNGACRGRTGADRRQRLSPHRRLRPRDRRRGLAHDGWGATSDTGADRRRRAHLHHELARRRSADLRHQRGRHRRHHTGRRRPLERLSRLEPAPRRRLHADPDRL